MRNCPRTSRQVVWQTASLFWLSLVPLRTVYVEIHFAPRPCRYGAVCCWPGGVHDFGRTISPLRPGLQLRAAVAPMEGLSSMALYTCSIPLAFVRVDCRRLPFSSDDVIHLLFPIRHRIAFRKYPTPSSDNLPIACEGSLCFGVAWIQSARTSRALLSTRCNRSGSRDLARAEWGATLGKMRARLAVKIRSSWVLGLPAALSCAPCPAVRTVSTAPHPRRMQMTRTRPRRRYHGCPGPAGRGIAWVAMRLPSSVLWREASIWRSPTIRRGK